MARYVCVHGHFYQPPRENPWLESIALQAGALPWHNWNERIQDECYRANACARILGEHGVVERVVNNYSLMSFNIGPTLLSWMEEHDAATYARIIDADRRSAERFDGHGSAIAQAYNHIIMPLASDRDRRTQVRWGVDDFRMRFGREPEGMWLPETAVCTDSLEALAEHGIRFTILAPHQAAAIRQSGEEEWTDVDAHSLDTGRPYEVRLPSGRSIAVFFYHGPLSHAVAFDGLLKDGETFATRLAEAAAASSDDDCLTHIATDGESYGHHHHFGEMALAYLLDNIEGMFDVTLTNYAAFLAKHPPTHEAQIVERSSWSCEHGVERWRAHCGCADGLHARWGQHWRGPLRDALDDLRDALAAQFEAEGAALFADPWSVRDEFVTLINDRSRENVNGFLSERLREEATDEERVRALLLLEMQRHALLMFTSCGWFFDDLSRIECVQVMRYAARAIELAALTGDKSLGERFLKNLSAARSNDEKEGDGRQIFEGRAMTSAVSFERAAAGYAVESLVITPGDRRRVFRYWFDDEDMRTRAVGRARLALGNAIVRTQLTRRSKMFRFCVYHDGAERLGGALELESEWEDLTEFRRSAIEAFNAGRFDDLNAVIATAFPDDAGRLENLFDRRDFETVARLIGRHLDERGIHDKIVDDAMAPLIEALGDCGVHWPWNRRNLAEYTLDMELRLHPAPADHDNRSDEERGSETMLDEGGVVYAFGSVLEEIVRRSIEQPTEMRLLDQLETLSAGAQALPFHAGEARVQHAMIRLRLEAVPVATRLADEGNEAARAWLERLSAMCEQEKVRLASTAAR